MSGAAGVSAASGRSPQRIRSASSSNAYVSPRPSVPQASRPWRPVNDAESRASDSASRGGARRASRRASVATGMPDVATTRQRAAAGTSWIARYLCRATACCASAASSWSTAQVTGGAAASGSAGSITSATRSCSAACVVGGATTSSAPRVPADSRRKSRLEIVDIVTRLNDSAIKRGFKADGRRATPSGSTRPRLWVQCAAISAGGAVIRTE